MPSHEPVQAAPPLTIIAIPKAFRGQFYSIQWNAITSWTRLHPRPEIVLLGDDEGTAEIAKSLGLWHVPEVDRNEYGTPLVRGIFGRGEAEASSGLICYLNSDIIVGQSFMDAALRLDRHFIDRGFLGVGRKTNLPLDRLLDFSDPNWWSDLSARAERDGDTVTYDSDIFLYRRGAWPVIPAFAIGRCYWSSWFMYDARRRSMDMIDMTPEVLSIEPRHDYSHATSTGGHARLSGVEFESNRRLFRGCHYFTTADATLVMHCETLEPAPAANRLRSRLIRAEYWTYFLLKGRLYPYSLPLVVLARWTRAAAIAALRLQQRLVRRHGGPVYAESARAR